MRLANSAFRAFRRTRFASVRNPHFDVARNGQREDLAIPDDAFDHRQLLNCGISQDQQQQTKTNVSEATNR